MIILIVLALYGISFLLSALLEYLLWYYGYDADEFWEELDESTEKWIMCPVISPFIFIGLIGKVLRDMAD